MPLALHAGETGPAPATPPPDLWQQSNLTGNWASLRDRLHDSGADFYAQYTSEALGNPYGGNYARGATAQSPDASSSASVPQ